MSSIAETFKPETKSIKQIFTDSDAFYQMPIYQRPYAWDKERVEQLWYDILSAYKNNKEDEDNDPSYFLGSIVVIKNKDGYEVVDGQQRLTTLTILFCTLRDMNLNLKQSKVISNLVIDLIEGKQRLKLTTHLNNQAIFEEKVLKSVDFDATPKDKAENRFLQNAFYFQELIKKAGQESSEDYIEDFDDFIDYLLNSTTIIRITCFSESFAIKLFSVLNDRGLDLSASDIIKAHLLQNIPDEPNKRESFIRVWERIETVCSLSNESITNIFNLYLYYLKGENPRKSLQDELKEQFKNKDSQTIIVDVAEFADHLFEIVFNKDNDKDIHMLKYLPHSVYWKSILTTAKHVGYKPYEELKSLITKYYYQSWIAYGTSNRIKQTSFNIIKLIKSVKSEEESISSIQSIKEIIVANLSQYASYIKSLSTENAYHTKWHKPVLLAIEYHILEEKDFIEIKSSLQTEHILPLGWDRDDLNWKDDFTDKTIADSLINSLGNLTLLSGMKNNSARNRNFKDKIAIYKGEKKGDGITSYEITKKVAEKPQWTPKEIEERSGWLQGEIIKILKIE